MKKIFFSTVSMLALCGAYAVCSGEKSELNELQLMNAEALAQEIEFDMGDDKCDNGCHDKVGYTCHCYFTYDDKIEHDWKD